MLTSIRIQNFRSIRDASVKLGQVNLFIGPNNSGKSNFLKGIKLMSLCIHELPATSLKQELFSMLLPRKQNIKHVQDTIRIISQTQQSNRKAISLIIGYNFDALQEERTFLATEVEIIDDPESSHRFSGYVENAYGDEEQYFLPVEIRDLRIITSNSVVYKIEPASFNLSATLSYEQRLSATGSNVVNFLYNLSQNYKARFRALETDFARCVVNLVSVSIPADPNQPGNLKLKFFDKNDVGYWAEEVSEGVLYFLALLCIVHQPDPPKLLLLEEPEKGIHPRRIREVMDFIFELAQLRGIQIILTSHSPYVVDHFADIPECISVFDRENDETVIRNAGDLIAESNAQLAAEGQPPIRYTDSLGEHWVSGFLGGVPA